MLALIRRNNVGTSFVEISAALASAGFDPNGAYGLPHPADRNMVMWAGASDLLIDALNELLSAHLVHYKPTNPLVYLADGGALNLPLVKHPPQGGYRDPHWLPMVINYGPAPGRA